MGNGILNIGEAPYYEDFASLKKWVRKSTNKFSTMRQLQFIYEQAGTGAFAIISEKGGETIVDIGAEGAVYGWCEANVAADLGKEVTLEYLDDAFAEHTCYGIINVADSTTEFQFMTESGGAVPVADFYRVRDLCVPTALGATFLAIGPTGGAAIYGIIENLNHCSIHSTYYCPTGKSAWLGNFNWVLSVGTRIVTQIKMTFVPYGHTDDHYVVINNDGLIPIDPLFRMAAGTRIQFEVIGNLTENTVNFRIIEAVDV